MKIIFLIGDLDLGGQERQLSYLASGLAQQGHQVKVIVWEWFEGQYFDEQLRHQGVEVHGVPVEMVTRQKIKVLRKISKDFIPDIVHAYAFFLNFAAVLAVFPRWKRAVGSLRTIYNFLKKNESFKVRFLNFYMCPNIISNNYIGTRQLKNSLGPFRAFIGLNTISNCIDLNKFKPIQKHQDEVAPIKTVSIGRISEEKRWDILIQALSQLKKRGYNFVHTMIGYGPLQEDIERLIDVYDLHHQVIIKRVSSGLENHVTAADFLIHTSEIEGTPNVVMEGMACGLPVVTTNCGDVEYIVTHNKNGFIVPINDVDAIVESCTKFFEDRELMERMGKSARQTAEHRFDPDGFIQRTLDVYKKMNRHI